MKKLLIPAFLLVFIATVAWAGFITRGSGKVITATTTPQVVWASANTNTFAKVCRVTNLNATNIVYFVKATVTNDFVTTDAIPVALDNNGASSVYTTTDDGEIKAIVIATAASTADVIVAFE